MIGVANGDMDGPGAGDHADAGYGGDFGYAHFGSGGLTVGAHIDGYSPHGGSGGFWQSCGRLLHSGGIPLMGVLSLLSLFM